MKKKVLVFHPFIQNYRIDLFNRIFAEFNTRICVDMLNGVSQTYDYSKILSQLIFSPILLDSHNSKIRKIALVIKQLLEFNPDVVIVSECGLISIIVTLFNLLTLRKIRIISIVDDSHNMAVEGNQFSTKHTFAEKCLFPFFYEIICVEPKVTDHFKNLYGKGTFFPIISNEERVRISYEELLPLSQQYIEQYNLIGKKVLLFVGRMVEVKNIPTIIRSFIKSQNENTVLVVVGSGVDESRCKALAQGHDNIIFTGRLEGDALNAWYNIANTLILASKQEPFGAVTNEALIGGCYALVSNKAGSQCLIQKGQNGFIIDPSNEEEIAHFIEKTFEMSSSIYPTLHLRESNMPYTFNEKIQNVLEIIRC